MIEIKGQYVVERPADLAPGGAENRGGLADEEGYRSYSFTITCRECDWSSSYVIYDSNETDAYKNALATAWLQHQEHSSSLS